MYLRVTGPKIALWDNNGVPAVGYKIYTLEAGSVSTLVTTYKDTFGAANTNPVVLDARGECVILSDAPLKLVFTTPPGDLTSPIWTEDYVLEQQGTAPLLATIVGHTTHNNYVATTSPTVSSVQDDQMVILTPDETNVSTIGTQAHTGPGIDDATFSGPYIGDTVSHFDVEIDSVAAAIDAYIKLLLHGDGSGATFVDSSMTGRAVTANGDVTQSAAEYKFGGKSILFDGAGDFLSCLDSDDWYLANGAFTIDFWLRFTATTSATFVAQHEDANNTFYIDWDAGAGQFRFYFKDSSTVRADYSYAWAPSPDTWYYIQVVRDGSDLFLYIDGTKVTWTTVTVAIGTNSLGNLTGLLTVGYGASVGTYLTGYIDEFCWSKGIARNTAASFTVPTQAYEAGGVDTFQWSKDGTVGGTLIPITADLETPQYLIDGVSVSFSVDVGHTLGDVWDLPVETPATLTLCAIAPVMIKKNVAGTLQALDGGDMVQDIPSTFVYSDDGACYILNNPGLPVLKALKPTRARRNIVAEYTVQLGDNGLELSCVGTFDVNLPLCTTIPNIFVWLHNAGSGIVTLKVAAGAPALELIYRPFDVAGATSYDLPPGASIMFETNGVDVHILSETVSGRGYQLFDTVGANDFKWPYGVTAVKVSMCGGGGGGGYDSGDPGTNPDYFSAYITGGIPGTTYTVTVGAGGAGGVMGVGGGKGGDGDSTLFDAFKTTIGGGGGASGGGGITAPIFWFGHMWGGDYGQPGAGGGPGASGDAGHDGFAIAEW